MAPLSMGFPRQEHWHGLHFLLQEIYLTQGWNLHLLHWQVDSLPLSHLGNRVCVCVCVRVRVRARACVCVAKSLQSCLTLCDPIDSSPQAPLSMGFSRQEYWSGLSSPLQVIQPLCFSLLCLLHWQVGSLPLELPQKPIYIYICICVCVCIYIYIYICYINTYMYIFNFPLWILT